MPRQDALLEVEDNPFMENERQRWRVEKARLRTLSAAEADKIFADPNYTKQYLEHLTISNAENCSHKWLYHELSRLLHPELTIVDMGCGSNPLGSLPCRVVGLDRHNLPGQVLGKMENPPLASKSADVMVYSLSLYGTASDLLLYFTHTVRILKDGGHLFIVEPDSAFTPESLIRFVNGLRQFGFEMVGNIENLHTETGKLLKGFHLTLTGLAGRPEIGVFERKRYLQQ